MEIGRGDIYAVCILAIVVSILGYLIIRETLVNNSEKQIFNEMKVHFNSHPAIIKSPAVLEKVQTYEEFDKLWESLGKPTVFEYSGSLYIVPDARLGYFYDPSYDTNWLGVASLAN